MTSAPPTRNPFALGFVLGPTTAALMLLGWVAAFYPFDDLLDRQGTPLGGDYVMFYLGGQIAADGVPQKLYYQAEHCERLRTLFPQLTDGDLLPYRYPPFVAAALAPLARLPLPWSFALFFTLSLGMWLMALALIKRTWPEFFATPTGQGFWFAALGWPVALETLIGGQASLLALLIATAGVALVKNNRPISAGAVLALAIYKPNVLALFILGCLLRYPRMLLGFIPVAAALVLLGVTTLGWETTWTYATLGQQLASQTWQTPTPFWKVHGLASWLDGVAGGKLLVLGLGVAGVGAAAFANWKSSTSDDAPPSPNSSPSDDYLALLLGINALCNPYLPIYDLALLLLPLTLLTSSLSRQHATLPRWLPLLALGIFFGPHLSQALSYTTHGQAFTLVLLTFVAVLAWRTLRVSFRNCAENLPYGVPVIVKAAQKNG